MPVSAGEFGADALAAFQALIARPEVTGGAIAGHSMGAIGAILAGAADERVAAIVATSSPADPYTPDATDVPPGPPAHPRPDRLSPRLADDPRLPAAARPRVATISASAALVAHDRPILLVHGDDDDVVPVAHLDRLFRAAAGSGRSVESLVIHGGQHSWLYEFEEYRRAVACFLATTLGGPYAPAEAADRAAAVPPRGSRTARPRSRRSKSSPAASGRLAGWRSRADRCAGGDPTASIDPGLTAGPPASFRRASCRLWRSRLVTEREMSVWQAISTKRAIRTFADTPLEPEHLDRILRAGRRSGSSKNLQRWDFIVCRDREHLRELAAVGPFAGHLAGAAVGIALVTPDPAAADAPLSVMFDLGQAAAYMMLAAWELGIGSVPATVYEHDLAAAPARLPGTHHCEYILSFGYPADPTQLTAPNRAGARRPLDEIVHEERW